jgi:hypothetical protein
MDNAGNGTPLFRGRGFCSFFEFIYFQDWYPEEIQFRSKTALPIRSASKFLVVQMETKTMKAKWLYGGVLASAIAIPAFGQISVSIGTPPPPVRYEVRPAMPSPGYVWVDGYWGANGGRYVWVPGVWRRPPYAGAYWSHPHYDHYNDGWHMHEGHWDHEDHGDHHEDHHGH